MIGSWRAAAHSRTLQRILITLALSSVALAYSSFWFDGRGQPSDFEYVWYSARALSSGQNPYHQIGPGRAFDSRHTFFYPLPATLVALPLAAFPSAWADRIFVTLGVASLAWVLTRKTIGNPLLFVFASLAMVSVLQNKQWSPLLTAAALTAPFGGLLVCKPSLGAALWAGFPSTSAIIGGLVLVVASLAILPAWPRDWLEALRAGTHIKAPVQYWGGPLLLLAFVRWRRPEGRLLGALSCIPFTPILSETVPLFLVVQRSKKPPCCVRRPWCITRWCKAASGETTTRSCRHRASGWCWVFLIPCLIIVLRRPNVWPSKADADA